MDSILVQQLDPSLECNGYNVEESRIVFDVSSTKDKNQCPYCGTTSSKVHSVYIRSVADIPVQSYQTLLRIKTKKMFCTNPECTHKTFSESFSFVDPSGRKTKRLLEQILRTSLNLSSIHAASVLKSEHIPVCKSTICQMIKKNATADSHGQIPHNEDLH